MKRFILAVSILALGASAFAAPADVSHPSSEQKVPEKSAAAQTSSNTPQNTACSFNFSSGSGATSINFCVTGNGNIPQLEIPAGLPMVSQASHLEGYGICDRSAAVAYSDWGGVDSGNWGPATLLSQSASSVKIARSTGDGIWTLTQTITQLKGATPGAKVGMALTNNSAGTRDVYLVRYADMDVAGLIPNNFDATTNTAMAWNSLFVSEGPYGVVLQSLVVAPGVGLAVAQNTADPPDPCSPTDHMSPTLQENADGSLEMVFTTTIRPHATFSVAAAYKGR